MPSSASQVVPASVGVEVRVSAGGNGHADAAQILRRYAADAGFREVQVLPIQNDFRSVERLVRDKVEANSTRSRIGMRTAREVVHALAITARICGVASDSY